jgi:hypothetical protein
MQYTKSTAWFTHFEKWAARATGRPYPGVPDLEVVLKLIGAPTAETALARCPYV